MIVALKSRRITVLLLLVLALLILGTQVVRAIPTNLVGGVSPMATQTNGSNLYHNLILSDHGKVQSVLVGMYFNTRVNQQFRINVNGAFCDMYNVAGTNYDRSRTYLVLEIGGRETRITGAQACNGWLNNQVFDINADWLSGNYRDSRMFGITVQLRWVNDAEANCPGRDWCSIRNAIARQQNGEGSRIRFRFDALGAGKVGLIETGNASTTTTNNSIVHATGGYADIYSSFGLSCSVRQPEQNGLVSVYDADNGTATQAQPLYFYVGILDSNGNVNPLSRSQYGGRGGGAATSLSDIWTQEDPNGTRQGVNQSLVDNSRGYPVFTPSNFGNVGGVTRVRVASVQPLTKYVLMIKRMNSGQFVYVGLPGDAIFGSPNFECSKATVIPKADPDQTIYLGESATFHNWAETKNTDGTGTDTFKLRMVDVGPANLPAAADVDIDRQLNPDRDVPTNLGEYTFTPSAVGRYCRETRISNYPPYVETPQGTTRQQCITVQPRPGKIVTIKPVVVLTGGDEVEAESDTTFSTHAEISGYPNFRADEWGYRSVATKANARNLINQETYSATTTQAGRPAAVRGACTNDPPGPTTCDRWRWTCPNTSQTWNQGSAPTCPMNYRHVCRGSGEGPVTNTSSSYTCSNRWNCNGTITYSGSRPSCNWWQCRYGASAQKNADIFGQPYGPTSWPTSGAAQPFRSNSDPGSSLCQARCDGGTGDLAGQANPGAAIPDGRAYDQGDLNCYERPSFSVTCVSRVTLGVAVSPNPTTTTTTVNRDTNGTDGRACASTFVARGQVIGDRVCVRVTPQRPSAWNPVSPEQGTGRTWGFIVSPAYDEQCKKVIGKPYVRVVGGDAANGRAAAATSSACTVNTGAQIRAWNKGNDPSNPYAGSGASVAAFTYSAIDQFASGQFANPILGSAPKALTFANTAGVYGTGWGAAPPCIGLDTFTGTPGAIPTSVSGKVQQRISGNVFIGQNIVYAGNTWADLSQVPLYQLVVEGDIYIGQGVTQLDGTFVATGNIYTCATGVGAPVIQTWGSCKYQLVVNGALIANQVMFARDCATLNRAQVGETTVYTGGTVDQHCSLSGTKASEVINFLPEQWIRSGFGRPSDKYDAITNMPPIL